MALRNRHALITGASSGIGAVCARLFGENECSLALTGRNESALKEIAEEIRQKYSVPCKYIVADVTNDADVANVVKNAAEMNNGRIDILINCAGVLEGGAVDKATMENWDFNFNTNARGVFCFMREAIPFMERKSDNANDKNTSSIVNVSSVNGLQSFGGVAAYCASKAAVDMLSDCAAVDLAPKKIRVNCVNPGVTVTELQKRGGLNDQQYQAFLDRSVSVTHPLGRVADPIEVAEAILFLASDKSSFITGTHLKVDGGRSCLGAR